MVEHIVHGYNPRLHSSPNNITVGWTGDHRGDFQGVNEQLKDILLSIQNGHTLCILGSWRV